MSEEQKKLIDEINRLKKEKDAIILVHNYQRPEIYEVADYIGDSLGLSIEASKTKAKLIVFCGVDFMAESAKILNPEKKVLIPTKVAKCPMAAMADPENIIEMKKKYPDAAVVCYVNTTAATKAVCDICCTSRNVLEVVNSLSNKKIIFVPDEHMGRYLKENTNKEVILWKGFCYVHSAAVKSAIEAAKDVHPDAKVIAHPECPMEVLKLADKVCGTEGMVKYAKESPAKKFIVITEEGMVNRLKREIPNKTFYAGAGVCFNQKAITLKHVYDSLKNEQYEIKVPEEIRVKAKKALDKMLAVQ
jgi:quinolinate synthase